MWWEYAWAGQGGGVTKITQLLQRDLSGKSWGHTEPHIWEEIAGEIADAIFESVCQGLISDMYTGVQVASYLMYISYLVKETEEVNLFQRWTRKNSPSGIQLQKLNNLSWVIFIFCILMLVKGANSNDWRITCPCIAC